MSEPYLIPNEVQGELTSNYVHGTDSHLHLVAIGLFPTGGGFIRVQTTDGAHWALLEYTGVSTNDLTGLTQANMTGLLHTDAAYTFPTGAYVYRVCMGEDVSKRIMGPASATAGHFFKADGTTGKLASAGAIAAGELPAIPLTGLATQAPDTIVANVTAGSAAPTAVAVAEQRLVGRITGGHVVDLTAAQVRTLINVADGAAAQTPWTANINGAGYDLADLGKLNFDDATELTIASGAITVAQAYHTVDTEADAATDDLDTISGGTAGDTIYLRLANAARKVVLKHNTGNIHLPYGVDFRIDNANIVLPFIFDGTDWACVGKTPLKSATKIYLGTNQDLVAGDWRLMLYDTDSFDTMGESVLANNKITVIDPGQYLVGGSLYFGENMADNGLIAFKIVGSTAGVISALQRAVAGTNQEGLQYCGPANLVAGESITAYGSHYYTENRYCTAGAGINFIFVIRIG